MNKYSTLIIICLLSQLSFAGVYKWTDEHGKVHFSDKKPKSQQTKDITKELKSTNTDSSGKEQQKIKRIFAKESAAEKSLKEKNKIQENKKIARYCQQQKYRLRIIKGRFSYTTKDGKGRDVSQQEQRKMITETEANIAKKCS